MKLFCTLLIIFALCGIASASQAPCQGNDVPFREGNKIVCESFHKLTRESTEWLRKRMPTWDKENEMSLFGTPAGADGLNNGLITVGVNATLLAKSKYPWAWDVPKDIFMDYILPYANVNEARNSWRPVLEQAASPLVIDFITTKVKTSVNEVFHAINGDTPAGYANSIWTALGNSNNGGQIVFMPGSTPLIYDPMSTIVYGGASCTGVSILLVNVLRSIGIAARVVGTPAWNGVKANGNHNWIEIYFPEENSWYFGNGAIAGNGPNGEDFSNPCDKWFCNASNMANNTQVYAVHYDNTIDDVKFPMAWDLQNTQIPGIDRSRYYQKVCGVC